MSIALVGRNPVTFEFKSANLSALVLRLKASDLEALSLELQSHYGDMPSFFEDDLVIIDLSYLPSDVVQIDFDALKNILHNYRLQPVAAAGGNPDLMALALKSGLPAAPEEMREQPLRQQVPADIDTNITLASELSFTPGAMVIDKPLRSGQQIYARGRDLVLLAACNSGSEVIADGHVHVYAPLRGRAIAGARGWSQACVFSLCMKPEIISIAGVYFTSEQCLALDIWGKSAMAQLITTDAGDKLIFNTLT